MNRNLNLRDVAVLQAREKFSDSKHGSQERTMIVIGNKQVGKTSIINQLIDREKDTANLSSTYLLDYKYGRKSNKSFIKDVCNIWELGNDTTFVSLLSVVAKVKRDNPLCVVIVVDLTSSKEILHMVDTFMDVVQKIIAESVKNAELESREIGDIIENEDRPHLKPFPVPLVIIGGKYDEFQNVEPSEKRAICQYLRCFAHIMQADLIYYSNADAALMKKTRDLLLHYAFGISCTKSSAIIDYNKPLKIMAGSDSFQSIYGSASSSIPVTLESYKENLLTRYGTEIQNIEDLKIPDDPARDSNFLEPTIDNLCRQKLDELNRTKEKLLAVQMMNIRVI